MFLADGEEMPRPGPPWEGCLCSHPASSSPFSQGASSLPPEKGNRSLASSTMERALVSAFCFQQLGLAGGETSGYTTWLTKRCLVKAAACVWSSAPLSRAGRGPKQTPANARETGLGLGR